MFGNSLIGPRVVNYRQSTVAEYVTRLALHHDANLVHYVAYVTKALICSLHLYVSGLKAEGAAFFKKISLFIRLSFDTEP